MDDLLFLAHRIPYPPRKGDKIRSYHLLRALGTRYRVHLGAFVDDAADASHVAAAAALCTGQTHLERLHPWPARLRALRGFVTGEALTFPYYDHPGMRVWVQNLVQRYPIRRVVVYSAAPFPLVRNFDPAIRRMVDLVDVDSAKWAEYAEGRTGFFRWLYRREARLLLEAERKIAALSDGVWFVSEPEAELFRHLAPESAARIDYWENGVDLAFFSPEHDLPCPYAAGELPLVFTGAMDYWPNVDAVCWFARAVFVPLVQRMPSARMVIVGGRPTAEVLQLQKIPGITVTGNVPDVRPWIRWARAATAPLRIARGVQNKVLEALAMAKPVLATSKAMAGIRPHPELQRWVADTPQELLEKALLLLQTEPDAHFGRQWMQRHYDWQTNLRRALDTIESPPD